MSSCVPVKLYLENRHPRLWLVDPLREESHRGAMESTKTLRLQEKKAQYHRTPAEPSLLVSMSALGEPSGHSRSGESLVPEIFANIT